MSSLTRRRVRLAGWLVVIAVFTLFTRQATYRLYPIEQWPHVAHASLDQGLDPLFVAAVIRVESSWNPLAESGPGARGLMQIMPATGLDLAERLDLHEFDVDQLFDPVLNIRLGTLYLAMLQHEFSGNRAAALAAYNGGRAHVQTWLSEGHWSGEESDLGDIPFPETRAFVQRVLHSYEWYERLYHVDGRRRW